MKPYYQDNHNTLYCMDFRNNDLPDESVQCVVTSPPYWGLRKYSGEQELIWGEPSSDNPCRHEWNSKPIEGEGYSGKTRWQHTGGREGMPNNGFQYSRSDSGFCSLCGAWKGAYGLEPTPEMYVQHTIEILREIRRVLRSDGVCFWNLGDSYWGGKGQSGSRGAEYQGVRHDKGDSLNTDYQTLGGQGITRPQDAGHNILKPKDLCLIPFRVAIAAQMDNWWVRSVIIWSKPNPMPESVTDRPTESHEYILMLTKSKTYYWDMEAVREKQLQQSIDRMTRNHLTDYDPNYPTQGPQNLHFGEKLSKEEAEAMGGRNIRSVWEFPTQPYPEAHFAVFPEKLPELCIKAATPEVGCCSKCGSPWERVVNVVYDKEISKEEKAANEQSSKDKYGPQYGGTWGFSRTPTREEMGWQPTCKCNADKVPSIVLDPFAGAGTTLWVAKKLNRQAIGYEISEEYCQLAVERMRQQVFDLR